MDQAKAIQEVIATERRWVEAHRQLDLAVIEEIMAEDYTQIRSDGSVIGKAQALASYASQTRHWDQADSDQYQVRIYGDLAILIGRWIGQGENDQEAFDYTARFLAVYKKTTAGWKLAADQSTTIEDFSTDDDPMLKSQLWGWGLFVLCALLFITAGVRANDILTVVASLVFLVACFVFIVPLVKAHK